MRPHFPLWSSSATPPFSFETFPHAATCALLGRVARGRDKAVDRLAVLRGAGIRLPEQRLSQDDVDAALCALAAKLVASGDVQAFGQQQEGFIVIPRLRGEAATCDSSEHIYCLKHCPHVVKNHSLVKANVTPACCFMLALFTSKLPRTPPTPPRFAFV